MLPISYINPPAPANCHVQRQGHPTRRFVPPWPRMLWSTTNRHQNPKQLAGLEVVLALVPPMLAGSPLGLMLPTFFGTRALPWRTRTLEGKFGKPPSYNFGITCFQLDTSDDWAPAHHAKPCHTMLAMPCLGSARRAEVSVCVERGYAWKSSRTCTSPNAIKKSLVCSKLGLMVPTLFCASALPWRTRTFKGKSGKSHHTILEVPAFN